MRLPPLDPTEAQRELCRRSLARFVKYAWPILEPATPLKWGWATEAIAEHLEAVTRGEVKRLLMNVPPGSMKSLLTSVLWPAWEWGPRGMASTRYLATAHKQDLAVRDNMKCRRLIQSEWFQRLWPTKLTGDQNSKLKFENSATGFREAMAFTSLTGSRGDRVILDDPHSVDDANSPTKLAADITTFREALPSRVNNDQSAIVIIMQRLHERDVSAVAIDLGYEHLCIPMRYESGRRCVTSIGWTDPRTTDGELMFPERFPPDQVAELERTLGSYATAGQLQQRPVPREGGMFRVTWLPVVDTAPQPVRWVRRWDLAASADGDYTAGVLLSQDIDGGWTVRDVQRDKVTPAGVRSMILRTARQDGPDVHVRFPRDPGAAGVMVANELTRLLAGFNARPMPESGSKIARAEPFAAQAEAGMVRVLRGAWNQDYIDEMTTFPAGAYDDQVDATSGAFAALAQHNTGPLVGAMNAA